ncbi:MAG TPA: PEPxxWA-CTERM sorting domain-containing protein, partial [Phenylobacterium sp.]
SITENASHELFETLTNPDVHTGWFDHDGRGEIADTCQLSNFDANLNGSHFDVQSIYARNPGAAQGVCASGYRPDGHAAGAPEPNSWALMLGGFGLAGAALRRRTADVRRMRVARG